MIACWVCGSRGGYSTLVRGGWPRLCTAVALWIWASLHASCSAVPESEQASLQPLRVLAQPYLVYAPLRVAHEEGYFAEQGLDVELVEMASSERAMSLLIGGSVDVLPANPAPGLFNAIGRGEPIRIVAEANRIEPGGCSSIAIIARPDLLASASESGLVPVRRISVNRQAVMRYLASEALAQVGVDLDSLQVVSIPPAVRLDALASGSIDAVLAGEPFLTRTLASGKAVEWVGVEQALPGVQFSFIFFGRRLLEVEPEAGARFLAAYLKAARQLARGKTPENIRRVARATGEDPATLERVCWPFHPTDGQINATGVVRFQEWAVERGLLDNVVPESSFSDPSYIKRAHSRLNDSTAVLQEK